MLFDTPVYFVFLALVVVAYWRLRWRAQNALLLAASYFFYGWWDWRFLLLMLGSTAIDYVIARQIEDASHPAKRRALLIASLVVNFTILGFFKYFNFFLNSTAVALDSLGFHNVPRSFLAIILPPGISLLYLSGSGLHRRRLCRKNQGLEAVRGLWVVHQSVSAFDCRSNPAAVALAPPGPKATHVPTGSLSRWLHADPDGVGTQDGDRRQLWALGECSL
jgi:hypothetical protein